MLSGSDAESAASVTSALDCVGTQISLQTPNFASTRNVIGAPTVRGITESGNTTSS